ncbi:MAG: VIT domain-containing protein, partial [Abditibacteriaceae bacterium]
MQKQNVALAVIIGLILTTVCIGPHASADILLKAVGKNEISLRPKTMDSQIDIHGQIAQIETTLTMASELDIQSEADFEYTVPDNTLVTYFAYWYKGKKVVARIVTKERAAEIYRIVSTHKIRDHHRWTYSDPAIVEMKDKNTFHVRIFPIEANADLKVEIHSVQMLDSDAKGSVFAFPLKASEKNKGTFEKIHLQLKLHPDSDVSGISNNYNLPLVRQNDVRSLDL